MLGRGVTRGKGAARCQIGQVDDRTIRHRDRSIERMGQLADIAGPVPPGQFDPGGRRQAHALGCAPPEQPLQQPVEITAHAQGGGRQNRPGQSKEQVVAERTACGIKSRAGRGDDPQIVPRVQQPEQGALCLGAQIFDPA